MVHMYEPVILVLLSQRGEVAVDLVLVATGGTHLNRQMLDTEICADPGADGMEQVIGQCRFRHQTYDDPDGNYLLPP